MLPPDYRAEALAAGESPRTSVEIEFTQAVSGSAVSKDMDYAISIYKDTYKSEVIEAFLLAKADPDTVYRALRVPITVTQIYSQLFFDPAVFKDELDVEAYAQTYPEDSAAEKWGKELKICAITLGLDYLQYRFSHGDIEIDIAQSLKRMITDSFMLSRATKLNPLDSNASREARGWLQTTVKAIEAYVKAKPATENNTDALHIALENIERTTNAAKSEIRVEDITH